VTTQACHSDGITVGGFEWLQTTTNPGELYVYGTAEEFVVSWENILPFADSNDIVNFQITLFPNGNLELRWGQGRTLPEGMFGVMRYDSTIIPVSGFPFDKFGTAGEWPLNTCRGFIPDGDGYGQLIPSL